MGTNSAIYSAIRGVAITPHASTGITGGLCRAVWVGGAGDAVVVWGDGTTSTLVAIPAGTLLPIEIIRVNAVGTTATSMVALY